MALVRVAATAVAIACSGCFAFVTKEEGDALQKEVAALKARSTKFDEQAAQLKKATDAAEAELKRLKTLVDEATKVATRNSADVGLTVQKLEVDFGALTGRLDDVQATLSSLSKSFTDYRATSDTKIEQVVNATTVAKAPPIPETADGVFSEAKKRYEAKQWNDARRLFDAFIARYPSDKRGAEAQYLIGEAYLAESKFANAIGAFTKVIDNFPRSEIIPDAMYKNGMAFYALKYCGDARIYFQELLKRYPKTEWKRDAQEELKKLQRDVKNRSVCQS